MSGNRAIDIGGDAVANQIVAGDHAQAAATFNVSGKRAEETPRSHEHIQTTLDELKELLTAVSAQNQQRIALAMAEAKNLAQRPEPPRAKVAAALREAIDLAGGAVKLQEQAEKLRPVLKALGQWLGKYAPAVLSLTGIALS